MWSAMPWSIEEMTVQQVRAKVRREGVKENLQMNQQRNIFVFLPFLLDWMKMMWGTGDQQPRAST